MPPMHFHQTWLPFRAPPFSISDSSCFQAKIWHMLSKERGTLLWDSICAMLHVLKKTKNKTTPSTHPNIVEQFFRSLLHLVHIELEQTEELWQNPDCLCSKIRVNLILFSSNILEK